MRARAFVSLLALAVALGGSAPAGAQAATASLAGTVTAADGEPLEGVCVNVDPAGETVRTDADGAWQQDELDEGEYMVTFNSCAEPLPGFAVEFFQDAESVEDATPVRLQEGESRSDIDASLDPAGTISGAVTDDDTGEGLADVCVLAIGQAVFAFSEARTDADGGYALANLRGGDYSLFFSDCSDPFTHRSEAYDDVAFDGFGFQEPTTVTVAAEQERADIDAGLEDGGSVRGTLTGLHTGEPLSLVCVGLFAGNADDRAPFDPVTVSGFVPGDLEPRPGEYVFAGIRPDTYAVGFSPEQVCGDDDGYVPQFAEGQDTLDDAEQFTVGEGEVVEGVDAVLAPAPSISSACFDGEGPSSFPDVPEDNVHKAAIECVLTYGIVNGRTDGTYGPADLVRRDQMATFVAGALQTSGVELPENPPDAFSDDGSSVHHLAINQLAALGVITGTGGGRYAPADDVSRGQMATFLVNGYEEATDFTLRSAGDAFTDDGGSTHEQRIDKAAAAGLLAGTGDGAYQPLVDVRRDQMATFVARLVDRVQRDLPFDANPPVPAGSAGSGSQEAPAPSEQMLRFGRSAPLTGSSLTARRAAALR